MGVSVATYFINVDEQAERREAMQLRLATVGLEADRVRAKTPADIAADLRRRHCDPTTSAEWVSEGELACTLSHVDALWRFIASGARYGLILEDDVHFSQRLPMFLEWISNTGRNISLVRLEAFLQPAYYHAASFESADGIVLRKAASRVGGTAAYIVSQRGARLILRAAARQSAPYDVILFDPWRPVARQLQPLHCDPGLCIQTHRLGATLKAEDSLLQAGRTARWQQIASQSAAATKWQRTVGTLRRSLRDHAQSALRATMGAQQATIPYRP